MTTQPKTTADIIIGAIGEFRDGKIYWADCAAIIKANLAASASELSALQKEVEQLKFSAWALGNSVMSYDNEIEQLRTQNRELEEEIENLSSELALRIGDKLEITTLGKQNRKLRELLKDVLKSSDALWYEKQMGHDWNDCVDKINKALALQPEK